MNKRHNEINCDPLDEIKIRKILDQNGYDTSEYITIENCSFKYSSYSFQLKFHNMHPADVEITKDNKVEFISNNSKLYRKLINLAPPIKAEVQVPSKKDEIIL